MRHSIDNFKDLKKLNKDEKLKELLKKYEFECNELDEIIMCWNERNDMPSGPYAQNKQYEKCDKYYKEIINYMKQAENNKKPKVKSVKKNNLKENKNKLFLAVIFWKYTFEYKLVYAENTTKAQNKIHNLYKDADKKPEGINIQEPII
jgi:hypothetical protein